MRRLKVENFGTECQGIRLRGDKRNPEPTYVRVQFPGGEVNVVRCDDGSYWAHVTTVRACDSEDAADVGAVTDARADYEGEHASASFVKRFRGLYHLAVRIAKGGAS